MPKTRHVPERSCVACGQKRPKRALVRIVKTPTGEVRGDLNGKAAGRGAYLCNSYQCWDRGVNKGSLERGLRISLSSQDRDLLTSFYHQQVVEFVPVEENNDL